MKLRGKIRAARYHVAFALVVSAVLCAGWREYEAQAVDAYRLDIVGFVSALGGTAMVALVGLGAGVVVGMIARSLGEVWRESRALTDHTHNRHENLSSNA